MSGLHAVSVSLATYKAIESQRLSFTESHDAIIRRALAERSQRRVSTANRVAQILRRAPRRRGNIHVRLFGQAQQVLNLKDAYLVILAALVRKHAGLFQLLAIEGTARRRWIATSAEALFVTSPHLAVDHAHEIAPNWFVDTNLSRAQIVARLTIASARAGFRYGEDVTIVEA